MRVGALLMVLLRIAFGVATWPNRMSTIAGRQHTMADLDVNACFNSTDSTECLQRGFDAAGELRVLLVVPAMPSPWIVTPLYLRRNDTHVRLAPGAIIEARRAAPGENDFYAGYGDCLITIRHYLDDAGPPMNSWDKHKLYPTLPLENISLSGGPGSTLRMWKQDYMDRRRYNFTEHRHAISAEGVHGLSLSSLRIQNSGGDGIDLSGNLVDIAIRNVIATENYRQGMSVISAVNMLVQDSVFERTRGTAPESGVDFEPDFAGDRLSNITFINVSTVANHGAGFSIWTGNLRENGLPIKLQFINCSNTADYGSGVNIGAAKNPGSVEFEGHVIQDCRGPGVYLNGKNYAEFRVVMRNSVVKNVSVPDVRDGVYIDDNGLPLAESPIFFGCLDNASRCGGVLFDNVTVDDSAWNISRNFLSVGWRGHPKSWSEHHIPIWTGHNWTHDVAGAGVVDLHGHVRVFSKAACCPSGRPVLVSDGEGGRLCRSSDSTGDKVCCLTEGDRGCPFLTQTRAMPLCRHLPGYDQSGHCDTPNHVCTSAFGPIVLNVSLAVECNPRRTGGL